MTIRIAAGARPITVAVVGDIHDQWSEADGHALKALAVDLVLFVGDIGNEAVGLVRQIAALDLPKAVYFRQPRCLVLSHRLGPQTVSLQPGYRRSSPAAARNPGGNPRGLW